MTGPGKWEALGMRVAEAAGDDVVAETRWNDVWHAMLRRKVFERDGSWRHDVGLAWTIAHGGGPDREAAWHRCLVDLVTPPVASAGLPGWLAAARSLEELELALEASGR